MALMPMNREVLNALVIQRMALLCILFNSLMLKAMDAPLKNYSWKPYIAIGMMHVRYKRCFWRGRRPFVKFSSIFMALSVERHLVV